MSQGVGCLSKGKMGGGRWVSSIEISARAILRFCACEKGMLRLEEC